MIDPSAPDVLIVSGLDPSGGAGFIADTRVVHELGGRPIGVISAQTVQDTNGVRSISPVDPETFDDQLSALLADIEIKAVKIGMLASMEALQILDDHLASTNSPVIWDPIFAPSQGTVAIDPVLLREARVKLGRHATLITPNLRELAVLSGATSMFASFGDAIAAAQKLASMIECAVLVKGGHAVDAAVAAPNVRPGIEDEPEGLRTLDLEEEQPTLPDVQPPVRSGKPMFVDVGDASFDLRAESIDVLVTTSGVDVIRGVRHGSPGTGSGVHGTGCALSSAIATLLARGGSLSSACREAKQFVAARIAGPVRPGRGAPSVL
ncbi:MAG TPA: hydroxymethylpyrimidine/phosphomethylpyrimidine kinase [Kofleriaceae bacterium]|jgi:hydroxymethylpyrimidine kinase/phosphomethylpyrimidine kinase